ncbi:MAG: NAD-dependent epimerase/dehydratase family protein [Bacteriovoracia bacterium]
MSSSLLKASSTTQSRVVITGATGFIGSSLVEYFSKKQKVLALSRRPIKRLTENIENKQYNLSNSLDEIELRTEDTIVHCAYVSHFENKNSDEINVSGTKRLYDLSKKAKVKRFIFLSSLSAHKESQSHYGRHKFKLEKNFDLDRDVVISPGLIIASKQNSGGIFQKIYHQVKKNSILPIFSTMFESDSAFPIYYLSLDDLILVIEKALSSQISGHYRIAYPIPVSLSEMYQAIARHLKKSVFTVPISPKFAKVCLKVFEKVGVSLPVNSENLNGLLGFIKYDLSRDLSCFNLKPRSLEEILKSW